MKAWKIHFIWLVIAIVMSAVLGRALTGRREAAFRERERELENQIRELEASFTRGGTRTEGTRSGGGGPSNGGSEEVGTAADTQKPPKKKPPRTPPTLDEIQALLQSAKRDDRRRALREILRLTDKNLQASLMRQVLMMDDEDLKYRAVSDLDDLGKSLGTQLAIEVLQSGESSRLRARAIRELEQMEDSTAFSVLQNAFQEDDPRMKYYAAKALQKLGWDDPVRKLVESTSPGITDPDGAVREDAVKRLGDLGTSAALPPLRQALQDPNSRVRKEALKSLSDTGLPEAMPIIEQGLQDSNRDVREEAIDALYDFKDPQVIPLLQKVLNDPDASVVRRAQRAIDRLQNPKK